MVRKTKLIIFALLCTLALFTCFSLGVDVEATALESKDVDVTKSGYFSTYEKWKKIGYKDIDFSETITPENFILQKNDYLINESNSESYGKEVFQLKDEKFVEIPVVVPTTGLYSFNMDYFSKFDNVLPMQISIHVNDEFQYFESSQISIKTLWANESKVFPLDRYNNDFYIKQKQVFKWLNIDIKDSMNMYFEPLRFMLEEGSNIIKVSGLKCDMLLGNFTIKGYKQNISYNEYLNKNSGDLLKQDPIITEAETPDSKSSPTLQPAVNRSNGVTPFNIKELRLNILGGNSWNAGGERVDYLVDVSQTGYYNIALKVLQAGQKNLPVYRSIYINDKIPFKEAEAIPFYSNTKWKNVDLGYNFYLTKGINKISFEVTYEKYREMYFEIFSLLQDVNDLGLYLKRLTGNSIDVNLDWEITEFLPTIEDDLDKMINVLTKDTEYLQEISNVKKSSEIETMLKMAIKKLKILKDKPNEIPKKIKLITSENSSVAKILGDVLPKLLSQPLDMDKFYVYGNTNLEKATKNVFSNIWISTKRFFISFFDKRYEEKANKDELTVWVNRPKQYVDLLQKLADESYKSPNGKKVKISLLADEGKLILANSANRQPDLALGVSAHMPNDLSIKGALADLNQFSDMKKYIKGKYNPESLVPLIYDDKLYAIPDTANFYVLFYRKDILKTLEIDVPNTWDDLIKILPKLRQYGLDFYMPMSDGSSKKSFASTLPFLFQYQSNIYSEDSFTVDLENEQSVNAIKMMTELYSVYSLPQSISNFYNNFRLGTTPIGIADFGTYIKLINAAKDIDGLWDISEHLGIKQENGETLRYATGAQSANIIFNKSNKQDQAWDFLKWWQSTETQIEYANLLSSTLGPEYMWNTANLKAFEESNWNEKHKEVILNQWSYLKELPKIPGAYMIERELSNIWNKVVMDGENLQNVLSSKVDRMNKEIKRKMIEYNYLDSKGNVIKKYKRPTRKLVNDWLESEA